MLTVEGAKLVVLVLNALHGLMVFYQKDYAQVNVDGLFGLRVLEGQLKHLWTSFESGRNVIPSEIIQDIKNLSLSAEKLANRAIPHVFNDDPNYFKQFKYLVNKPYDIMHPHKLTDPKLLWPPESNFKPSPFSEEESDKCIGEMLQAVAKRAEHPLIEDPLAPKKPKDKGVLKRRIRGDLPEKFEGCNLSRACLELMLANPGAVEYKITHQLLYTSVAELTDCARDLDEYLVKTGGYRNSGLDGFRLQYCTNLLSEMQGLARSQGKNLVSMERDLFMEMVFTCGQFGFVEFVQIDWLEWILSWQDPSGCYGISGNASAERAAYDIQDAVKKQKSKKNRKVTGDKKKPGTRKLLVEKPLADDCLSHASAVAVGALTMFLRFLLDPGPKEWSHLRLDLQRTASKLKSPLENAFRKFDMSSWSLLKRKEMRYEVYDELQGLPPSQIHDFTAGFAILLFCLFVYVSWRLFCRRKRNMLYPWSFKKL